MTQIETALTFENPEDDSALQLEMDTSGYAITVFDADGSIAVMNLDRRSLIRLTNFLTGTIMEDTING